MTDLGLYRSSDLVQFSSWYCAKNVVNLSLVISGIYVVSKRISEYYEYFKRFQLNIQLKKGYPESTTVHIFGMVA